MPEEKLIAEQMHIRCKIIIEMLGKPKEHVEKTLGMYVDKIKSDSNLIVLNTEFADAQEKKELPMRYLKYLFSYIHRVTC